MDDASSFEGPADPEAEALSKAWGPEETFVVLPRLESLRGDGDVPWIEQISWSPRAQVYHNFLTPEECDHLVEMARPRMSVASVVDKKTGASKPSDVRTSTGHFIRRAEDAVVRRIEERIAAFAMVPVDHGEGIQILRYERGQKYDPHFDYFTDDENVKHGGQRVATVLMYLSDVERGGETVFRGERVGKEHEAVAVFKSRSRSSRTTRKTRKTLPKDASPRRARRAGRTSRRERAPRFCSGPWTLPVTTTRSPCTGAARSTGGRSGPPRSGSGTGPTAPSANGGRRRASGARARRTTTRRAKRARVFSHR